MFLEVMANNHQKQKASSFSFQARLAMFCSEYNTWGISSEGYSGYVLFKTAFNCFCIELYSWMCIHQRMKSNVTFLSFTKSTSIRCHSIQKWGNQEKAELFFIMCWKMSAGLKCQSIKKKKKKKMKRKWITFQMFINAHEKQM